MVACRKCKFWGLGDGKGFHYDAGLMAYCHHPQLTGEQHPSKGACGEPVTMLYVDGAASQLLMTRHNFGCVLGEL